jgi:hypothetical protein
MQVPLPLRLRGAGLALALAAACLCGPALAQQKPGAAAPSGEPKPAQIDRNGVLILVRSTLLAVHDANITGNYTVLRDLGAPGFQASNTAARLSEIFANLRNQNLDLSGLAVLDPQLTVLPQIEPNGLMRMAGFFPSVPLQVNFDLLFAPVGGKWRLFGISVGLGNSSPAAPGGPEPKASEAKPPEPVPAPAAPTTTQSAKPEAKAAPKPTPKRPPARAAAPRSPAQPAAPKAED